MYLKTLNGYFGKHEDPDEMPHNAHFFGESITSDPLIYTMEHSDLIVSIFMGNAIGIKRVKLFTS